MRPSYEVDWAFAAQASLQKLIQEQKPEEVHRWPLMATFDAEFYRWRDSHLILVLRDKLSGIPAIGSAKDLGPSSPSDEPSKRNIEEWVEFGRDQYEVGARDLIMIIPIQGSGPKIEDDWREWSEDDKLLWQAQLVAEANRHLGYLRELDARRGVLLRSVPSELGESLEAFREDHPDPERTGFLMMRLTETPAHVAIADAVRETASRHELTVLRADDREYHSDLYFNVLTYVYGCGFGIAVFERIEQEEFNPNVSLEVGYMLALNKPVCFLKDRTLRELQTDLLGKLYRQFDPQDPEGSIPEPLTRWLSDKGLIAT